MSTEMTPPANPAVVAEDQGTVQLGLQPQTGLGPAVVVPPTQPPPPFRRRRSPYPFFALLLVVGVVLGYGSPIVMQSLSSSESLILDTPTPVYPIDDPTIFASSVTAVWVPVQEAAWYYVQLFEVGNGSTLLTSLYVSAPSHMFSDLADGTYGWTVRAEAKDSQGDWSQMSFFSVRTSLEEPVPIYPVGSDVVNSTEVHFQWAATSGADRYELQISPTRDFDAPLIEQFTSGPSYLCGYPLSNGTTYYWRVMAFESEISSPWSAVAAFTCSQENTSTVAEPIHVTWNWTFPEDGSNWSYSFNVTTSEYDACRALVRNDQMPSDYSKYITDSNSVVVAIASYLAEEARANNMTDYEAVWFALSFVHATTYVSDIESTGYDDYARYPVETLVDGVGDCEDTAALFTSIVRAMGYDTVMLYIYAIFGASSNHMGAAVGGIAMPQGSYSIMFGGEPYYYCETTPGDWAPGELPQGLVGASYVVVS